MAIDKNKMWIKAEKFMSGEIVYDQMFRGQWVTIKPKTHYPYGIKTIQVNEKKKLVTVVFDDEKVEIVKCSKEDTFDVNIGIALAIANHHFGSKTQFHKFVEKKAKFIK